MDFAGRRRPAGRIPPPRSTIRFPPTPDYTDLPGAQSRRPAYSHASQQLTPQKAAVLTSLRPRLLLYQAHFVEAAVGQRRRRHAALCPGDRRRLGGALSHQRGAWKTGRTAGTPATSSSAATAIRRRSISAPTSSPPSSTSSATRSASSTAMRPRPTARSRREFNNNEFSVMTYASYHRLAGPTRSDGRRRRLLAAELHDVRHLGAAGDVRRQFQHGSAKATPIAGTNVPASRSINGEPAPNTGVSSTSKIFSTVWTQGAAATYDLSNFSQDQVDDLRPGHWLTFSNDQLADLNVADPSARSSRRRATSTTRCSTRRPALGHRQPDDGHRQRHADRQRPRQRAQGRRRHRHHRHQRRQRHGERRRRRRHDPFRPGGYSTLRDSVADLNGDVVREFGFGAVDVLGLRLGWNSISITAEPDHDQRRRIDRRAQRQLRRQRRLHPVGTRQRGRRPYRAGLRQLPAQPGRRGERQCGVGQRRRRPVVPDRRRLGALHARVQVGRLGLRQHASASTRSRPTARSPTSTSCSTTRSTWRRARAPSISACRATASASASS